MGRYAKRIFAGGAAAMLLAVGAAGAGTAAADPGNGLMHGQGPAACFGPPGQLDVQFERQIGPPGQLWPPGEQVSSCAQAGR